MQSTLWSVTCVLVQEFVIIDPFQDRAGGYGRPCIAHGGLRRSHESSHHGSCAISSPAHKCQIMVERCPATQVKQLLAGSDGSECRSPTPG